MLCSRLWGKRLLCSKPAALYARPDRPGSKLHTPFLQAHTACSPFTPCTAHQPTQQCAGLGC